MIATIFCTFDQQDLADLAIGQLRGKISGIHNVHYIYEQPTIFNPDAGAQNSAFHPFQGIVGSVAEINPPSAQPMAVKIICDQNARDRVVAQLINLHAHRIVSIP